jgi:hypothetical protein
VRKIPAVKSPKKKNCGWSNKNMAFQRRRVDFRLFFTFSLFLSATIFMINNLFEGQKILQLQHRSDSDIRKGSRKQYTAGTTSVSSIKSEPTLSTEYYPPLQQINYLSPVWGSSTQEEPWSVYGPLCGIWYGVSCSSRSDEAHPGGEELRKVEIGSEEPIYPKSTGRLLPGKANWTDLLKTREAFNYPGPWRGQEYLDSVRAWEKKMYKYSDMVGKVPGMAVGVRKLYNNGRKNFYTAYRQWYSKYLQSQKGNTSNT